MFFPFSFLRPFFVANFKPYRPNLQIVRMLYWLLRISKTFIVNHDILVYLHNRDLRSKLLKGEMVGKQL